MRKSCLVVFSLSTAACAQVVQTPEGKAEFIGLHSTTPQELIQCLEQKTPGKRVHLCAATLKECGLADAAVEWMLEEGGSMTIVVTAVEGSHKDRVRYRAEPSESTKPVPPSWRGIRAGVAQPSAGFQMALMNYGRLLAGTDRAAAIEAMKQAGQGQLHCDEKDLNDGWDVLESAAHPSDYEHALWAIGSDSDAVHRAAAACVLANFADRDESWHALADALRDPHAMVSTSATQALASLTRHRAKHVDWAPAAETIRMLLDGTNPFALRATMRMLLATEVDPALASRILPQKGGLLIDIAEAQESQGREVALTLLRRLSGQAQANAEELRRWAAELPR
jgi:hypothetical protein